VNGGNSGGGGGGCLAQVELLGTFKVMSSGICLETGWTAADNTARVRESRFRGHGKVSKNISQRQCRPSGERGMDASRLEDRGAF
jgi:hypothetical protein